MNLDENMTHLNVIHGDKSSCLWPCSPQTDHGCCINDVYAILSREITQSAVEVFGLSRHSDKQVPGWNQYVKHIYLENRENFIYWREGGTPRHGLLATMMRIIRSRFKLALWRFKNSDGTMKAQSIAEKLKNKQYKNFWKEFRSMNGSCGKRPHTLDDVKWDVNHARLWKLEFQNQLNCVNNSSSVPNECSSTSVYAPVSAEEICMLSQNLGWNKATERDGIPPEVFKKGSAVVYRTFSALVNMMLCKAYIPND